MSDVSREDFAGSFFKKIRSLETAEHEGRGSSGKNIYHTQMFVAEGDRQAVRARRARRRKALKLHARKMPHRQLKRDGLYAFHLGDRTYKDFLPIHDLWSQYIVKVLGTAKPGDRLALDVLGAKLLKADLHGSFLTVVESRTPSLIGHAGIVLFEYRNSFLIVTKDSRLVQIPKYGVVFAAKVGGYVIRLHGTNLRHKASERAVQKFRIQLKPKLDKRY